MSTIQAPSYNRPVYQGTHGNLSVAVGQYIASATASGTQIDLISLPPGCRVATVLAYTDTGMGTGVGVKVSLGSSVVATVGDMSAAGTSTTVPVALPYTTDETIVSTTITGGAATGDLIIEVFYIYEGTL